MYALVMQSRFRSSAVMLMALVWPSYLTMLTAGATSQAMIGHRYLLRSSPGPAAAPAKDSNVYCDNLLCMTPSFDGSPGVELLDAQDLGFIDSTNGVANQNISANSSAHNLALHSEW